MVVINELLLEVCVHSMTDSIFTFYIVIALICNDFVLYNSVID